MSRKPSLRAIFNGAVGALALLAAGGLIVRFVAAPIGPRVYTDGYGRFDEGVFDQARRVIWEDPHEVPGLPTGDCEGAPALSPDGRTLYFTVGEPGGLADIWIASLAADGSVTGMRPLDEVNSLHDDLDPFPTEDAIYFVSDRPGSQGGLDMFVARREGDGFGEPEPLAGAVNSPASERSPTLTGDGRRLVFASDRWNGVAGEGFDLFEASREGGKFGPPRRLVALDSPEDDVDPYLWADGSRLVFSSNRPGGRGGLDLWWSLHADGEWLPPQPLDTLNSGQDDRSPHGRDGGFSLLFASDRAMPGLSDLYSATSSELFPLPRERSLADLLVEGILVLLLLLAIAAYLANRWTRLDILVKCLLISILLHLLLVLWFRSVEVSGILESRSTERTYRIEYRPAPEVGAPAPEARRTRGESLSPLAKLDAAAPPGPRLRPEVPEERTVARSVVDPLAPARAPDRVSEVRQLRDLRQASAPPVLELHRALPVEPSDRHAAADPSNAPPRASTLGVARAEPELPPDRLASRPSEARRPELAPRGVLLTSPPSSHATGADVAIAASGADRAGERALPEHERVAPLDIEASGPTHDAADPAATVVTAREIALARQASGLRAESTERESGATASPRLRPRTADASALDLASPESVRPPNRDTSTGEPASPRQRSALATAPGDPRLETPSPETEGRVAHVEDPPPTRLVDPQSFAPGQRVSVPVARKEPLRAQDIRLSPSGRSRDSARPASLPETATGLTRARPGESPASRLAIDRTLPASALELPRIEPRDEEVSRTRSKEPGSVVNLTPSRVEVAKREVFRADRSARLPTPPNDRARSVRPELGPATTRVSRGPTPRLAGIYSRRSGTERKLALREYGGSDASEQAVRRGLEYLARIQNEDGSWGRTRQLDPKYGRVLIGKTGLALLAFLASGHTEFSETDHSRTVKKALDYLVAAQDPTTGHFGLSSSYSHGIATYALAEAYAMTRDSGIRSALERGVQWILENQILDVRDPRWFGGWGYYYPDGRQFSDRWPRASVTVWQIMALKSAILGGIDVPEIHLEAAGAYLLNSFDDTHGYFRYNHDPSRLRSRWATLPASTPASIFGLLLLEHDRDDPRIERGTKFVRERVPLSYQRGSDDAFVLEAVGNLYFWYYSTLAMFLRGGDDWSFWNEHIRDLLVEAQNEDGSWTPISAYSRYADEGPNDRSYTTAMCVLNLEVYYRYFTPLLRETGK